MHKKEKRKKRKMRERRKKRGADPRPEEGRRNANPPRLVARSYWPWVEPVAGHTQAGCGSSRPGSGWPPRPMAPVTLFFDFFLMGLASVGLIFLFFLMGIALGLVF